MSGKIYRQGDLLFEESDKIPSGFSASNSPVILEGEATGHSHRLVKGMVFRSSYQREMFIKVENGGRVVHEEHATLHLPMGVFKVVRQIEYTPTGWKNVMD